MGSFYCLRLLKKMPKTGCCRRPTPSITATYQHQPWLGMRNNSSVSNKMQTLKSRIMKLFNLQTSNETKTLKVKKNTFVQQQVTPIVTEMIKQQSTLDSMLYVCEKLLPKMTLADKCIVQEVLTDRLYSDIIASSQSFIKEQSKKDIHYRLLIEKALSNAVEPLTGSIVFKKLVEDIAGDVAYMTNRQVVSLFLNLQLLDWEKECREVFKLFERIHGIKAQNLSIDEVVMYAHAFIIYKPSWYSTHTVRFLFHWCAINDFNLENTNWLEILDLLMKAKIFQTGDEFAQNYFEEIFMKLEGQNIQSLNIYWSLVLLLIFRNTGNIFKPVHNKANKLYEEMLNHVKKLIQEVGDREIMFLSSVWNTPLRNSLGKDLGTVIEQKFLQPLLDEKVLKNDVILHSYMLATSINQYGFMKESKENIELKKRVTDCLKNADAVSLKQIGHFVYRNFLNEHYHTIIGRVESFVREGLFEREEIPLSLKKSYGSLLVAAEGTSSYTGNKAVNTDVRDKFLGDYLKHHVYDSVLHIIGCKLCFKYPQMTPTSITFLENVKGIKVDPYISIGIFSKIKKRAKDPRYRRNLCKVSFSQSQSALSKLESDVIKQLGCCYQPTEFSDRLKSFSVYKSEPFLMVLSRHALSSKTNKPIYIYSKTDPRFLLDFYYNSLQTDSSQFTDFSTALCVCSDCFFWGYRPGDVEKISLVSKRIDTLDFIKDDQLKQILCQENVDWNQLIKERYNPYKKLVQLPKWAMVLLQKAFDNRVGMQIHMADNLYLDAAVLLDSSLKPVPFSRSKLETATKHGLKKVAFFFNHYSSLKNSLMKERLIKDLQKTGFKCVVIWDEELKSIANRTLEEKIQLIKTKVCADNSIINTAHKLSYDPTKLQEGPYKKYFSALSCLEDN